jgi:hypothetical protein
LAIGASHWRRLDTGSPLDRATTDLAFYRGAEGDGKSNEHHLFRRPETGIVVLNVQPARASEFGHGGELRGPRQEHLFGFALEHGPIRY